MVIAGPWPRWERGVMRRRVWALLPALALLAAACQTPIANPPQNDDPKGVRHGTLRVLDQADVEALDPGIAYGAADLALLRGLVRTLYSFDSSRQDSSALDPVPDLAAGPYQLSPDRRTYTFTIRRNIHYAPPYDTTVQARDFIYAIERQFDPHQKVHSPNPYASLIQGFAEYASGRARTISGMRAVGDDVLQITLREPASDFPSILTLPFFSPVPEKYARDFKLGSDYAQHLIASGPYALAKYAPGQRIELVRNQNWDPQSDPLRKAWVDRVEVTIGASEAAIQDAIESGDVDLNLDLTPPPNNELRRLAKGGDLQGQSGIKTTGCVRYLTLQTDSGATANPLVRQAINLAVDKRALVLALGGAFAGEPASTILSPTLGGYEKYPDPYGTTDFRGDPVEAKALLSQAGYPNGLSLNFVGPSTGQGRAALSVLQLSLGRAGIDLNPKLYDGYKVYTDSLQLQSKKDEHQIGLARWCPDVPGNGARSFIGVLLDGRKITARANNNYGDYNNPAVNAMIDRAYGTQDPLQRNSLWGQIDRRIMDDAPWVPLVYERQTYFWSSRVKQWRFSPWISNPDITNLWLDPNTP